eukprot:2452975-Pyramimonas_sp.AAC.1
MRRRGVLDLGHRAPPAASGKAPRGSAGGPRPVRGRGGGLGRGPAGSLRPRAPRLRSPLGRPGAEDSAGLPPSPHRSGRA